MEKINFEDATLKKSAYVTIGGTEYPVTDAEYVGGTDLDAATLNYAFKLMHPVGSIYMTTIETNPSEIFGFGTWELWGAGRVPVGVDTTQSEFNTIEKTGGKKTHTLTLQEIPSHNHMGKTYSKNYNAGKTIPKSRAYARSYVDNDTTLGVWKYSGGEGVSGAEITDMIETSNSGGNQPHNNLQPYITCYMFKRTA